MAGINTGLLFDAHPLSPARIKELERIVVEENKTFVYLNGSREVCFLSSQAVDGVKKIAWHNAYKVSSQDDGILSREIFIKQAQELPVLVETQQKQTFVEPWSSLLNDGLLDEFILE